MTAENTLEFFYDIVCPYAYLASTQIGRVAAAGGARVVWKPFLLGGVFQALGNNPNAMAEMSAPKLRHNFLDMHRWADYFDVPLRVPSAHPRRAVLALRAILAAGEENRAPASHALFKAYWVDEQDVADPEVVRRVLAEVGIDGIGCVARAADEDIKSELRRRTDEAVARGVFGAPTMFVGDEMFWGQDRLDFVARALDATNG